MKIKTTPTKTEITGAQWKAIADFWIFMVSAQIVLRSMMERTPTVIQVVFLSDHWFKCSRVCFIAKNIVVFLNITLGIERNIINYSHRTFGLQLCISIFKEYLLIYFRFTVWLGLAIGFVPFIKYNSIKGRVVKYWALVHSIPFPSSRFMCGKETKLFTLNKHSGWWGLFLNL